jgi:hypothetical protein
MLRKVLRLKPEIQLAEYQTVAVQWRSYLPILFCFIFIFYLVPLWRLTRELAES